MIRIISFSKKEDICKLSKRSYRDLLYLSKGDCLNIKGDIYIVINKEYNMQTGDYFICVVEEYLSNRK